MNINSLNEPLFILSMYTIFTGEVVSDCCRNRREREKERRRQDVLDAALTLFSQRGFHNVSMQEVAETAGFAVGTLYNFFANKEDLFNEILMCSKERVLQELTTSLQGTGSPVERLRYFVRCQAEVLIRNGDFIRLYVAVTGQRAHDLCAANQQDRDFREVLGTELARVIQLGIDQGMFRPVHADLAAKAMMSTLETLAFEDVDSHQPQILKETFAQVEALFIDGLLISGDVSNHA